MATRSNLTAMPSPISAQYGPGRQFGDALFIEYLDQAWTFAQFFDAVDALAGYLSSPAALRG